MHQHAQRLQAAHVQLTVELVQDGLVLAINFGSTPQRLGILDPSPYIILQCQQVQRDHCGNQSPNAKRVSSPNFGETAERLPLVSHPCGTRPGPHLLPGPHGIGQGALPQALPSFRESKDQAKHVPFQWIDQTKPKTSCWPLVFDESLKLGK